MGFTCFCFLSLCGRVSPVRFVLEGADVSLLLGLEWVSLFFCFYHCVGGFLLFALFWRGQMSLCCLVLNGFHFFLFLSLCGRVSPLRFVLEGADVSLLLGFEWVSPFIIVWAGFSCSLCSGGGRCLFVAWS